MSRILVVEDDLEIADFLRRGLVFKGYEVDVVHDGEAGVASARDNPPDLVLLELTIPRVDGVEVCRRLRSASAVPIIVIVDSEKDEGRALEVGADECVTKPFAFDQLLARVRAALPGHELDKPDKAVMQISDLTIDTNSLSVTRHGRRLELTSKEYDLLLFLAKNSNTEMAREVVEELKAMFTSAKPWKSDGAEQTRKLGEELGAIARPGDVILISGELGAGKTVFVQGIAQGMGYDGQVSSKSFVIMGEYGGRITLYHADLYRLEEPEQVEELGLGELTEDGVLVVEWPERGDWALPEGDVTVKFEVKGENDRAITLQGRTERGQTMLSALEARS